MATPNLPAFDLWDGYASTLDIYDPCWLTPAGTQHLPGVLRTDRVTIRIESHLRLRSTGGDKAKDSADEDTYQSDTEAVDGPSQNSTPHAEDKSESVLLLVSTLICVTPRANLPVNGMSFPQLEQRIRACPTGRN